MFYASRLVKGKCILNTNKFCVDIEKTSAKVVFCQHISPSYKPSGYKPPQNPLQSCISPGLISGNSPVVPIHAYLAQLQSVLLMF